MADDRHLTRLHYERLLRGELPTGRLIREFFEHLLKVCPTCNSEWHRFKTRGPRAGEAPLRFPQEPQDSATESPSESPVSGGSYGDTLARSMEQVRDRLPKVRRRVDRERLQAKLLLEELLSLPGHLDQVARVRRSRRFRNWALCDLLFEESKRTSFVDPVQAERLAEIAIEAAWSLEGEHTSPATASDLLARGWAYLANARRMGSDLAKAEETLLMAYFFIEQGTGDPLVHAEILSLEASLRRDQRKISEAVRLLDRARSIYADLGERHLEGRTLLQIGVNQGENGAPELAVEWIEKGLPLIAPERDPRLLLCFRHTLIFFTQRSGKSREAAAMLAEHSHLYDLFPDPWTQLRRRWLEGEIAEGEKKFSEAEAAFREVREGFIVQGLGYDAALVSLNLAALLIQENRIAEIKTLAGEMLPIFESREVHREAIACLILFQKAAQRETLTLEMLRGLSRYLERARYDSKTRFEEPS